MLHIWKNFYPIMFGFSTLLSLQLCVINVVVSSLIFFFQNLSSMIYFSTMIQLWHLSWPLTLFISDLFISDLFIFDLMIVIYC